MVASTGRVGLSPRSRLRGKSALSCRSLYGKGKRVARLGIVESVCRDVNRVSFIATGCALFGNGISALHVSQRDAFVCRYLGCDCDFRRLDGGNGLARD
jgi:hypothetical protein